MQEKARRVVLNISGEIYETEIKTLDRFPETLLGDRGKRLVYYCASSQEYFFNRSRIHFDAILFFYQSNGILRCPHGLTLDLFEEECRFFELPQYAIDSLKDAEKQIFNLEHFKTGYDCQNDSTVRFKLWNILENPETSDRARNFAAFSMGMVILSTAVSSLRTVKPLRVETKIFAKNPWSITEFTLQLWFLVELAAGILCTPNKITFFRSSLKWVDVIAVVPYFITLYISTDNVTSFGFLRIVRCTRIVRLFPITKRYIRLHKISGIIRSSVEEFKTLLLCLTIAVIMGGSFMFIIEYHLNGSQFQSIPHGLWWGIQTITTLGYGDIYPITVGGRLFAASFMIFGALFISLPVLTIVNKISSTYEQNEDCYT